MLQVPERNDPEVDLCARSAKARAELEQQARKREMTGQMIGASVSAFKGVVDQGVVGKMAIASVMLVAGVSLAAICTLAYVLLAMVTLP